MTTTLAASVFERLGDELWLLVPAFVFALLASALIGRVLGVRRSFAATVVSGTIGWIIGAVVAIWIAADTHPASDGFSRNLFLFTLARRDGGRRVARVPRPPGDRDAGADAACSRCRTRSGRCVGAGDGCSGTPRSPASRCGTGSARRSGSDARTRSKPQAAALRCAACASRSRSAAACS